MIETILRKVGKNFPTFFLDNVCDKCYYSWCREVTQAQIKEEMKMVYVTLSSTKRNERVEGKIQKYVIECKTYKQMCKAYDVAKYRVGTHYVHKRFSVPKYGKDTHVIVCSYEDLKEFRRGYKKKS